MAGHVNKLEDSNKYDKKEVSTLSSELSPEVRKELLQKAEQYKKFYANASEEMRRYMQKEFENEVRDAKETDKDFKSDIEGEVIGPEISENDIENVRMLTLEKTLEDIPDVPAPYLQAIKNMKINSFNEKKIDEALNSDKKLQQHESVDGKMAA